MTEVTIAASVALAGTLVEPASARITVVLIPGSGPIDRDGDAKRLPIGIQRQLATALTEAGIASLRWDKRGVGASAGDFLTTGFHDGVTDALAAVDHALELGRPVIVIGHSEGAAIASRVAVERPAVAGIVLLSPYARSGLEVLRWQARALADHVPALVRGVLRLLRTDLETQTEKNRQRLLTTTGDVARIGGARINARWFREFMAYDPTVDLAGAAQPVLAITGSFDLQSPPDDLERIAEARSASTTTMLIPEVSHLLRAQAKPSLAAYRADARRPVDARVISSILEWLGEHEADWRGAGESDSLRA